ncbi:MAG: response regulator [Cyclobacteriaceae bacterium]
MKIILVDDHKILIEGIAQILEGDYEIAGIFTNAKQALAFLSEHEADLLLTDYEMPEMNGIDLFLASVEIQPLLKGVLLSMHDEASVVKRGMKVGMSGFLLKNVNQFELKIALKKIAEGHTYVSAELTQKLLQKNEIPTLSNRELEVLKLIIKECPNKEIASTLNLSERTVETYRKNLFKKANTNNIVGLVKYAYANKLVG